MTNPANPTGPVNPVNQGRSAEPVKPGSDKFKDLMKIDSSAEKQKKKKKRSEETSEEEKAQLPAGPAASEKEAESVKKAQKYPKIQKIGESEKKQTKHEKRSEETTSELAREEAAATTQAPKKPVQALEITQSAQEETVAKTSDYTAEIQKELEHAIEEEEQAVQEEKEVEQTFKKIATRKEEPKKAAAQQPPGAPSSTTLGPLFLSPATPTAPAYSLLDAQTLALFEKMVSVITILKDSGITETTINLNTPEFANSQFYGAQIIIREYSTAPLTYNIELLGNPLAADLFQKNLTKLRSAFDDPKLRFRVNRLDSSISKEPHPRVERKKESRE